MRQICVTDFYKDINALINNNFDNVLSNLVAMGHLRVHMPPSNEQFIPVNTLTLCQ